MEKVYRCGACVGWLLKVINSLVHAVYIWGGGGGGSGIHTFVNHEKARGQSQGSSSGAIYFLLLLLCFETGSSTRTWGWPVGLGWLTSEPRALPICFSQC